MDKKEWSAFPQRLARLRRRYRISRLRLSELCGLNTDAIRRYEIGTPPSVKSLIAIADYFEVSTDYLLGRDGYAREMIG